MGPEGKVELAASDPDEKSSQELESLLVTSKRLTEEMKALAVKAEKMAQEHAALAEHHAQIIAESKRRTEGIRLTRVPAASLVNRALEMAERRLSIEELSKRLNALDSTVRAWRDGVAVMPKSTFLLLVDVLTELDPSWRDWDESAVNPT